MTVFQLESNRVYRRLQRQRRRGKHNAQTDAWLGIIQTADVPKSKSVDKVEYLVTDPRNQQKSLLQSSQINEMHANGSTVTEFSMSCIWFFIWWNLIVRHVPRMVESKSNETTPTMSQDISDEFKDNNVSKERHTSSIDINRTPPMQNADPTSTTLSRLILGKKDMSIEMQTSQQAALAERSPYPTLFSRSIGNQTSIYTCDIGVQVPSTEVCYLGHSVLQYHQFLRFSLFRIRMTDTFSTSKILMK